MDEIKDLPIKLDEINKIENEIEDEIKDLQTKFDLQKRSFDLSTKLNLPTKFKNQLETQRKYILNLINQQEILKSYIKDLENKLKLNNCIHCQNRQLEINSKEKL